MPAPTSRPDTFRGDRLFGDGKAGDPR